MRALLLAAGFGTRLRPLTDTVPKCLVPIHGKPLLGVWLEQLAQAGVGPFLVNTHYLPGQVRAFVADGPYRSSVTLAHETELLGTAGTLRANLAFFEGADGLLIHADNYCLADFPAFLRAHRDRPAGCLMTMMTFRTDRPSACGIVELDGRGVVVGFHEKQPSPPGNLANAAVYILSAELLARMGTVFARAEDFSTEVLPHLMGAIHTWENTGTLIDVGTPESYARANRVWP
jgi:mannose-1-phosphate guanylyltransferase